MDNKPLKLMPNYMKNIKNTKNLVKHFQEHDLTSDYLKLQEANKHLILELHYKEEKINRMSFDNEKLYQEMKLKNEYFEKELDTVSYEVNELKSMVDGIQQQLSVLTGKIQTIANTFETKNIITKKASDTEPFKQLIESNNAVLGDIQKKLADLLDNKETKGGNEYIEPTNFAKKIITTSPTNRRHKFKETSHIHNHSFLNKVLRPNIHRNINRRQDHLLFLSGISNGQKIYMPQKPIKYLQEIQ